MKKYLLWGMSLFVLACNNTEEKSTVEKADSINKAKIDSGLQHNAVVVDEASAAFLVKTANSGMAEVDMAAIATQKAMTARVKDFASMLLHDHSAVNEQLKILATQKNVALPDSISSDKRQDIDDLGKKTGMNFDKSFINAMVKSHEDGISRFEKAMTDAKDPDVTSFADRTLMRLRVHLDSAKAIKAYLR